LFCGLRDGPLIHHKKQKQSGAKNKSKTPQKTKTIWQIHFIFIILQHELILLASERCLNVHTTGTCHGQACYLPERPEKTGVVLCRLAIVPYNKNKKRWQ
jgi:hypothetical protein